MKFYWFVAVMTVGIVKSATVDLSSDSRRNENGELFEYQEDGKDQDYTDSYNDADGVSERLRNGKH